MRKRKKISLRKSKKSFTKHGVKSHKYNNPAAKPMRGGIRL